MLWTALNCRLMRLAMTHPHPSFLVHFLLVSSPLQPPPFCHQWSMVSTDPATSLSCTMRSAQMSIVSALKGCLSLLTVATIFDASPTVYKTPLILHSYLSMPTHPQLSYLQIPFTPMIQCPGSACRILLAQWIFRFISLPLILHGILRAALKCIHKHV